MIFKKEGEKGEIYVSALIKRNSNKKRGKERYRS